MIGSRHLGYFVLHVVKPLIEELDQLLGKCKHLKIDKWYIEYMVDRLIKLELEKAKIYCITYMIISGFLCVAIYLILKF